MLGRALAFLVAGLIAALVGFGGVTGRPAQIARVVFVLSLAAFVWTLFF